jgi:mannose-6-phosphate isomerase-like protein (cupin superfamily)
VIVKGIAQSRINDVIKTHNVGEVVYAPVGSYHQLKNVGVDDLVYIEVQYGEYFGEDDIVRIEDPYARI